MRNFAARPKSEIVRGLKDCHSELASKKQRLAQTRQKLETSRARYEDLYNVAPAGFVTLSADGRVHEINVPAARFLNHNRRDMLGSPFSKFIAEPDQGSFLLHLRRSRQDSQPVRPLSVELRLARKRNKHPIFIELFTIQALEKQTGKMVYKSVFRDITPLKQMQERNRWLAAIVESSEDAIAGIDLKGRITSGNKALWRLFGYGPEELTNKAVSVLLPAEIRREELKILRRALKGEAIEHHESVRQHKDGRRIDVSLTISPVHDVNGRIIGASKIARDITLRKRCEEELVKILDREKLANRAKDDFLAALSHELRTPLNPVLLLASDCATDPALPSSIRSHFETIRNNVELEARLIDDLLDLTRITRGKLALEQIELDAHLVLNDAVANVLPEIRKKGVLLDLKLEAQTRQVLGDPVRLQQIFWNVLKNALKFTPEGGHITVETRTASSDKLLINITDTGIGIGPDELERIFAAFSQGDHHLGGLGLGLAISRGLLDLHSGLIRAYSPGKEKGATFSIELPLLKNPRKRDITQPAAILQAAPGSGQPAKPSCHVLLVEDHEPTRLVLTRLLLNRHYNVTGAGSIAEARALMEKNDDFRLLISDIGLPDGRGHDLMIEFKKKFGGKGIALTGYGREEDLAESQASGFTTHLTKPIRIESLDHALGFAEKEGVERRPKE